METLKEVDHTAGEAQEDAAGETPERRHVDLLLDLSEEDSVKEQEPHEYHCYSGWDEAVRGWARVAPLSCILLTQKRDSKPKHKETENPTPSCVDPAVPNTGSSATVAEHPSDSRVNRSKSFKKSTPLNQHAGSCSSTTVVALQKGTSERHIPSAVPKITSDFLLEEKIEKEGMLTTHHLSSKCPVSENRPTKPPKHSHRPSNTVVPIKNFTFLPPIESPHLNPQRGSGQICSGKTAPEGENTEEACFVFDKKSVARGTRADPVANPELAAYAAALTSKYRTCQHNPDLFSAVSRSIPKRYQVTVSSKPDTVHCTTFSMGKSLTQALQSGTATSTQAHIHPSKAVCAVKLYEGCEINI
ncbi:hypothetical protein L3Q82_008978 [Scortum barcoo]|uniref:Uncharacterized protein n=1 Tax=Scortum barcoo TaxID=214431 RepID=A0ACB8XD29_9TELE|nr:hypothetical protein L3Q82_008978 [Scortum barcoo]